MLGRHLIKCWSSTQGGVALSSVEAEYYAMVEAATRAMGVKSLAEELGVTCEIVLYTDSSGAKSFASRRGTGKVRHIEVKWLWLQKAVKQGKVTLAKIWGKENPADLFTKYLAADEIKGHLGRLSVSVSWSNRT